MRITRLEAQGIGPFEDLNIEFKPKPAGMENKAEIHILTGENGTGKSTILMMLASIVDVSNDESLSQRFQNLVLFRYRVFCDLNVFEFDCSRIYNGAYSKKEIDSQLLNLEIQNRIHPMGYLENESRIHSNLHVERGTDFCFFGYSGFRSTNGKGIVNIKEIISNPFEDAVNFEKSIDSDLILDWVANVITKGLLSKNRGKEATGNNSVQKIEKALSDITGKKIEFDLEETLKVSVKVNDVSLSFNTLPDGLKSIISWLSDLLMRLDRINWADKTKSILEQNFILFLDEIEVHLHPSWQRKILPVVQDLFPNAQIFISTHSPFVVGSVDGARVYKFKLDENNNSVLDSEYWTEDGNSYQYYLREVFDIKNEFGVKIDESLQELQRLKEKALKGSVEDYEKFMILSDKLLNENPNSVELSSIVGFERRKLEKQFPTQPVTV